MYKTPIQLILNKKLPIEKIFIRNKELPICSKCIHFIEYTNNYPYEPVPRDEQYGRCKKFGEINMITGAIEHDLASNCRLDVSKCGKFGEEYIEKIKS